MGLTVKGIASLRRRGKPGKHFDADGLYLLVKSKKNAHWAFRYQLDGRERWMGLGSAKLFSLAEARDRAQAAKKRLADKIDPLELKHAERATAKIAAIKAATFAEAAQAFFDQHADKWRNPKHRQQFISTLKEYAYPVIGSLPVASIDTPLVLRVLERPVPAERGYPAGQFWKARPETASRVRGRIEQVLDWATARGYRSGDNPAAWKTIGKVLPGRSKTATVQHHAAMPYADLPAFMGELKQRQGVAARALEFAILTAARTGEVIGAKWPEFKLEEKVWIVPAGRMKAGREHRVALSAAALELLQSLHHDGDSDQGFVFIGSQPGTGLSNMSLTAVLKRMGHGGITTHGFRSSFKDWCRERTNFPNELSEIALAHRVGDKTEQAYARGDLLKRRYALAEAWARYCTTPPAAKSGENVVSLRAGA